MGITWSNKIVETTWKVAGNIGSKVWNVTPITAYQNEILQPVSSIIYRAKVGLMYASDYGYAADFSMWAVNLNKYDGGAVITANWMYMGLFDWTITPNTDYAWSAYVIHSSGNLSDNSVYNWASIRPVFYLDSSVKYISGSGTSFSPFIIE